MPDFAGFHEKPVLIFEGIFISFIRNIRTSLRMCAVPLRISVRTGGPKKSGQRKDILCPFAARMSLPPLDKGMFRYAYRYRVSWYQSQHSDKCRKAQALQNKREFDERARENNYDLLYKNECQNWRNKINRVKNTAGFPADRLEKIQAAFADFKKEALQRKKTVKTGTASPKEFTDWLYQQSNVIVELTEY